MRIPDDAGNALFVYPGDDDSAVSKDALNDGPDSDVAIVTGVVFEDNFNADMLL